MIISKLLNLLYNIDNSPALFIILLIFAIIIIIITSSIHIVPKNEVFLILRAKKDFLVLKYVDFTRAAGSFLWRIF